MAYYLRDVHPGAMGGTVEKIYSSGGKVRKKRGSKAKKGVGIRAVNPSDFTKALNSRMKREKRAKRTKKKKKKRKARKK